MQGHVGMSSLSEGLCVAVAHESLVGVDVVPVCGDVGLGSLMNVVYVVVAQEAFIGGCISVQILLVVSYFLLGSIHMWAREALMDDRFSFFVFDTGYVRAALCFFLQLLSTRFVLHPDRKSVV